LANIKWDIPCAQEGKLIVKFIDHSTSREHLVQPNIVEYDVTRMGQPGFDLILGANNLKEFGLL
jgi:hypothetical protein